MLTEPKLLKTLYNHAIVLYNGHMFFKKKKGEIEKVIVDAMWAVDAFDQANTNAAVVRLGSRGQILGRAIDDLRKSLKEFGRPSLLPNEDSFQYLPKKDQHETVSDKEIQ